jgi:hypothetical protein
MSNYHSIKYTREKCSSIYDYYKQVCAIERKADQLLRRDTPLSTLTRQQILQYREDLIDALQRCRLCAAFRIKYRDHCVEPILRNNRHETAIQVAQNKVAQLKTRLDVDIATALQQLNIQDQQQAAHRRANVNHTQDEVSNNARSQPAPKPTPRPAKAAATSSRTAVESAIDDEYLLLVDQRTVEQVYTSAIALLKPLVKQCGYSVGNYALPQILDAFAYAETGTGLGLHTNSTRDLVHLKTLEEALRTTSPAQLKHHLPSEVIQQITAGGKSAAEAHLDALRDPNMISGLVVTVIVGATLGSQKSRVSVEHLVIRDTMDTTLGELALSIAIDKYADLLTPVQRANYLQLGKWHIGKGQRLNKYHWPDSNTLGNFLKQHINVQTHLSGPHMEDVCVAMRQARKQANKPT